ncbi:ABC transporter permease [Neoroseomonas oryzicola]|uniref:ABC transporter permease n=1 Tax=Neoroseomonas oryzicola TaxID=535904 RepID=A0A9X9WF92_9PROT|nr:ABC transporter permease [Neoroseomonas oryzicola]MBR0659002.1 ABC transporter permease [Neoroseomonas oryzicola]NKE19736.1 ABC transporter permease [Neoroseomonas oryzicola]
MSATVDDIEIREEAAQRRRAAIRRYAKHPGFVIGACGILVLLVVALLAPWLAPHSPTRTDLMNTLAPPSASHWLGTDQFGRDVLSRLIYGAQVSLQVGFFVVLISLSAGTILGAVAGYAGGWVERALVAAIDILLAFPSFLLALALVAARGNTLDSIIVAVAIAYTPRVAAVMRSVVLTIRPRPFIEASRAIGLSPWKIILRHIIPNALPPVIVVATVSAATAILAEAGLSFLGLGVQPPTPTWGNVIAEGQTSITTNPLISLSAGLCIAFTVIVLNLLGDGLRDTLDPQMRRNTGKLL